MGINMRKLSMLAFGAILALGGAAQALDLTPNNRVGLNNGALTNAIGGAALANNALSSAGSLSGSYATANTKVLNTTKDLGSKSVANVQGLMETTALSASSISGNGSNINGTGTISGTTTVGGGTLSSAGTLNATFSRGATSQAATGLNGYSGSQLTGVGQVNGSVVGSALSGSGALSVGAR